MQSDEFKLGLLDFGYRNSGNTASDILSDVIEYAILADKLGYHSIWYGEHYNGSKAFNNPEILFPVIAGLTEKIKVGSGGILIEVHSPYRVAMTYKVLSSLFPGRIDLGIAHAASDVRFTSLLIGDRQSEVSIKELTENKSKELINYFLKEREYYKEGIIIPPYLGMKPDIWKLKTSFEKLPECLEDQTNFCCSLFHRSDDIKNLDPKVLNNFMVNYKSKFKKEPSVAIAFSGVCDVSMKKAQSIFEKLPEKPTETYTKNCIVGTPDYFRERLIELNEQTGVNYFIFLDLNFDISKRKKSIRMLSKEFNLS